MRLASAFSCALIVAGLAACSGPSTATTATAAAATVTTAATAPTSTAAGVQATGQGDQAAAGGVGGQGGRMPNLTPEQQAAAQAYRDCLTANGVTIPQRGNRAPGGSQPAAGDQATGAAPATGGQPVDPNAPAGGGTNTPRVNLDPAAMTKAQEACKDKLPADGTGAIFGGFGGQGGANGQGAGGQGGAARQTALVPYYACLKDNGITVADASVAGQAPVTTQPGAAPAAGQAGGQPGQGFTRGGRLAGVDQTSPEFTAANEKCKVLIPEGMTINGGGGPGGPPPGGDMATAPTTTVG